MNRTFLDRLNLLCATALMAFAGSTQAQTGLAPERRDPPTTVAYHIPGLTAGMRDAIVQQLDQHGGLKVTYACVPAGVLVFSPTGNRSGTGFRHQAEAVMAQQLGRQAFVLSTLDQAQLEAACAAVRNP